MTNVNFNWKPIGPSARHLATRYLVFVVFRPAAGAPQRSERAREWRRAKKQAHGEGEKTTERSRS